MFNTPNKNPTETAYRWMPALVFLFSALSFILYPQGALRTHQLGDPDDYMRLNEVIRWVLSPHPFGIDWYDLTQPRLSPGENVIVHWSRLVDLPIALFMLPFLASYGVTGSALISSFIVPPLLFVLALILFPLAARPLMRRAKANLVCVLILFAPAVLMNFSPGRVDHHAYQLLIAAFGLLALQRAILLRSGWKYSIAAAIAFACGLWIGTEALPWVIIYVGASALLGAWRGGFALRNAAVFGISLPFAVVDLMPLALRPSEFASRELSWFSGADFIFAMLAGGVLVIGWLLGRQTKKRFLRVALLATLSAVAAIFFLYFVPSAMTGGVYASYNQFFNTTLINNIGEAQPMLPSLIPNRYIPETFTKAALLFLHMAFLPMLASSVAIWNFLRSKHRRRAIWFIHGAFLIPAVLLMLFWQVRVGWFAQVFCLAPTAWLVLRLWRWAQQTYAGRKRFWAEIAAFVFIVPLPVLLIPAGIGKAQFYPELVLFPAVRPAAACPLLNATAFLNDAYGDRPRVILSGTNEGPELLFRTQHNVLAAPYNVEGNREAFDFFNAREERKPVNIALKRHIDLVLVCRSIPPFYAGLETFQKKFNAYLYTDAQGHLHMTSSRERPTLIERLTSDDIPAWMTEVKIPLDPNYLLFEVNLR